MAFRIAFVAGVTLTKWTRAWSERRSDAALEVIPNIESQQLAVLRNKTADVSFLRLPLPAASDEVALDHVVPEHSAPDVAPLDLTEFTVIRLYTEVPVAVLSRDHPLAESGSLTMADVADEIVNAPADDSPEATKNAVELVAAGVGMLVLPQSVARLHSRKDVVALPVVDASGTEIAIAWLATETTPDIEEFVGIVRGRTARSSRSTPTPPAQKPARKSQVASRAPSSAAHKLRARNAANARKRRGR